MQKAESTEARQKDIGLRTNTKFRQLVAYLSADPAHPGIYIDLQREGSPCMAPIALVEFTDDDCDASGQDIPPSIVCRVWGDAAMEDYTDAITCRNLDKYFEKN